MAKPDGNAKINIARNHEEIALKPCMSLKYCYQIYYCLLISAKEGQIFIIK